MAEIFWTEPTLNDLDAIADYIALESPDAARALVQRAFAHVDQLLDHPRCGSRAGTGFAPYFRSGSATDLHEFRQILIAELPRVQPVDELLRALIEVRCIALAGSLNPSPPDQLSARLTG